jgi:hypothetical protein
LTSESTYNRYPRSVGMRPAEVCGCVKNPASSKSANTLRTVAGDKFILKLSKIVDDPTGFPVLIKRWITACRIFSFRD